MNLLQQASEQRDQVLGDLKTLRPNDTYELEQRLKELDAKIKQEMQQELRRVGVQECQKFLKMMETQPGVGVGEANRATAISLQHERHLHLALTKGAAESITASLRHAPRCPL
jgi:transposase